MIKNLVGWSVLSLLCVVGLARVGLADDDTTVIDSEQCPCQLVTDGDFVATFGVDSGAVRSLASRIDSAQRDSDPIGLAMGAVELAALETATGRSVGITAEHVASHAIHLAKYRYDAVELRTVAALVGDAETRRVLLKDAARAEKHAEERQAKAEAGELDKGISNDLIVDNHTVQHLKIYYRGRYQGDVAPHGHRHFHLCDWSGCHYHDHWEVEAWGCDGGHWHRCKEGRVQNFTWCLH